MTDDPINDAPCTLTSIRTEELSLGQPVDQRLVSERLEVSRTPLREALRALESDGILTRIPRTGYAQLSTADLLQCYSMRTLLEPEVLRTIEWPNRAGVEKLRAFNEDCRAAIAADDVEWLIEANRAFHFLVLSWSPLTTFVNEIERIWRLSDPYRTSHYRSNRERRLHTVLDHEEMIKAVEAHDAEHLVALMDNHRCGSRTTLQNMLGPSSSPHLMALSQSSHHRISGPV